MSSYVTDGDEPAKALETKKKVGGSELLYKLIVRVAVICEK